MTIYDKKISVYDNLDCLEGESLTEEISPNDLATAKEEVSRIDDDLQDLVEKLEEVNDEHTDDDLTLKQVNEFFEEMLPVIIEELNKLRERLY